MARSAPYTPPVFDLRYHVASLTAVFIALVIGILVGVGLSGQGLRQRRRAQEPARARSTTCASSATPRSCRSESAGRGEQALKDFADDAYPVVVPGRLEGQRVAVLFVGPIDRRRRFRRRQGSAGCGRHRRPRRASIGVPIDDEPIERCARGDSRPSGASSGPTSSTTSARARRDELVSGRQDAALGRARRASIVEEREGPRRRRPTPSSSSARRRRSRARRATFLRGPLRGPRARRACRPSESRALGAARARSRRSLAPGSRPSTRSTPRPGRLGARAAARRRRARALRRRRDGTTTASCRRFRPRRHRGERAAHRPRGGARRGGADRRDGRGAACAAFPDADDRGRRRRLARRHRRRRRGGRGARGPARRAAARGRR